MNGFIWTRRAVFIFLFIHLLPLNKRPTTCGVLLQPCLLCGIFKRNANIYSDLFLLVDQSLIKLLWLLKYS